MFKPATSLGSKRALADPGLHPFHAAFGRIGQLEATVAAESGGRGTGGCAGNTEVGCDSLAFIAGHRIGHGHHGSEIKRSKDAGRWHLAERLPRRNSRTGLVVAARASSLVDGLSGGAAERRV